VERTGAAFQLVQLTEGNYIKNNILNFEDGFAFIGNPFMAAFDFDKFYEANESTIKPHFYVWTDKGYETYSYIVGGSSGDLNNLIAPLQGFIVEEYIAPVPASPQFRYASLPTVEFNFSEAMTEVNTSAVLRSSVSAGNKLEIVASNPIAGVRTFIAKREGGQAGFGNLDARKIINGVGDRPEIYTLKPHQGGSIATVVNVINSDEMLIPIGLATSYAGNITLTFTGMDNYDAHLSLIDAGTNRTIDLTGLASYDYVFNYTPKKKANGEPAVCEDRFFIRISKTATGLTETIAEKMSVFESDGMIKIVSGASNPIKEAAVYDLQGVLMYKAASVNAISHTIERNFPAGAYIVKVVSEKNTDNVKVIKR